VVVGGAVLSFGWVRVCKLTDDGVDGSVALNGRGYGEGEDCEGRLLRTKD
jgi:hypothetical protein